MIWTATKLSRIARHCAGIENHKQVDRTPFESGTTCHAILQAIGEKTNEKRRALNEGEVRAIADAVGEALISKGRSYYEQSEPPLGPERVWAGRDLALEFLSRVEPFEPGGRYEVALAVDENWNACPPDAPQVKFRGTLDRLEEFEEEGEEWTESVLQIDDYKSAFAGQYSARALAGSDYDPPSLQGKLYICLALANSKRATLPNRIRLRGWNLRTAMRYVSEWTLPAQLPEIEQWQRDLTATARAIEASGICWLCDGSGGYLTEPDGELQECAACDRSGFVFPYSPGANCIDCPAATECPALSVGLDAERVADPVECATIYAQTDALRDALQDAAKAHAKDEPVKVEGGSVGYYVRESRKVADPLAVADRWQQRGGDVRGFVAALGGLGVKQVEALAKVLYADDYEARKAWLEEQFTTVRQARFGVKREDKDAS